MAMCVFIHSQTVSRTDIENELRVFQYLMIRHLKQRTTIYQYKNKFKNKI